MGLGTELVLPLLWVNLPLLGNSVEGLPRGVGLLNLGFFGIEMLLLLDIPTGASLFLSADETGGVADLETSVEDSGLRFGPRAIISPAGIPRHTQDKDKSFHFIYLVKHHLLVSSHDIDILYVYYCTTNCKEVISTKKQCH